MSNYLAEFIGTFLLILLGNGVVGGVLLKGSKAENSGWIVIVLAWGLAVAFSIYAVGQYSGAHINPAVTIGLASAGLFDYNQVPGYILSQFAGAFTASIFVWLHYLPHWSKTEDKNLKLAVFCTAPAIRSSAANLFSEIMGTSILVGGIMFIGANKFTDGLNPLVIGALVSMVGFSFGGTTGFAINPARDLAPRIAHFILPISGKGGSDFKYAWIPVVGPVVGGLLGASLYQAVFLGITSIYLWISTIVTLVVIGIALLTNNHE